MVVSFEFLGRKTLCQTNRATHLICSQGHPQCSPTMSSVPTEFLQLVIGGNSSSNGSNARQTLGAIFDTTDKAKSRGANRFKQTLWQSWLPMMQDCQSIFGYLMMIGTCWQNSANQLLNIIGCWPGHFKSFCDKV